MKTTGMKNFASLKATGLLAATLIVGGASADTWFLKGASGDTYVSGLALSDLSYWTNSVGSAGSGAPTTSDKLVVPASAKLRSNNASASFVLTAKSLTVNSSFTHDWKGTNTWANDGFFLGAGAVYDLNSGYMNHPFTELGKTTIDGTLTVTGTSNKPSVFRFDQLQYSNLVYQVNKLVGETGTAIRLKTQNTADGVVNNSFRVVDASGFKGDFTGASPNNTAADMRPPLDNGEYGERIVFRNLDTPGTLTVGRRWVLGAEPGCVTKAATVVIGYGARLEVAVSEVGCSRLEATTALTVGSDVQIFLTGALGSLTSGRYPILTAPCEIDSSKFVLKKLPALTDISASLETEYADGVGTLYLKIGQTLYVDAANGNDAWDGASVQTPRKTLAAVMTLAQPYDTVYAAEGTYDEGEVYSGFLTSNRVVVPPYVTLEASGDRDKTIIKGTISMVAGNSNGCWSNAVRCVCLNAGSVVKGFTLRDGRTCNGNKETADNCGGAVYGAGRGLLVDSVITNCGAAKRGENFFSAVTLLRCRVESYAACGEGFDFYMGGKAIDTLICGGSQNAYRTCEFVNCTFPFKYSVWGNGELELCIVRNCLHLYVSSSDACVQRQSRVYNSYFGSVWKTTYVNAVKDDLSRFEVPAAEMACNPTTYRPRLASVAIGKGDLAMYLATTNNWPTTMRRQFTMKDMYGTDRLNGGALDLGAIQHTTTGMCILFR